MGLLSVAPTVARTRVVAPSYSSVVRDGANAFGASPIDSSSSSSVCASKPVAMAKVGVFFGQVFGGIIQTNIETVTWHICHSPKGLFPFGKPQEDFLFGSQSRCQPRTPRIQKGGYDIPGPLRNNQGPLRGGATRPGNEGDNGSIRDNNSGYAHEEGNRRGGDPNRPSRRRTAAQRNLARHAASIGSQTRLRRARTSILATFSSSDSIRSEVSFELRQLMAQAVKDRNQLMEARIAEDSGQAARQEGVSQSVLAAFLESLAEELAHLPEAERLEEFRQATQEFTQSLETSQRARASEQTRTQGAPMESESESDAHRFERLYDDATHDVEAHRLLYQDYPVWAARQSRQDWTESDRMQTAFQAVEQQGTRDPLREAQGRGPSSGGGTGGSTLNILRQTIDDWAAANGLWRVPVLGDGECLIRSLFVGLDASSSCELQALQGARARAKEHLLNHWGCLGSVEQEKRWLSELCKDGAHISTDAITVFASLLQRRVHFWYVTRAAGVVFGGSFGNGGDSIRVALLYDFESDCGHYEPLLSRADRYSERRTRSPRKSASKNTTRGSPQGPPAWVKEVMGIYQGDENRGAGGCNETTPKTGHPWPGSNQASPTDNANVDNAWQQSKADFKRKRAQERRAKKPRKLSSHLPDGPDALGSRRDGGMQELTFLPQGLWQTLASMGEMMLEGRLNLVRRVPPRLQPAAARFLGQFLGGFVQATIRQDSQASQTSFLTWVGAHALLFGHPLGQKPPDEDELSYRVQVCFSADVPAIQEKLGQITFGQFYKGTDHYPETDRHRTQPVNCPVADKVRRELAQGRCARAMHCFENSAVAPASEGTKQAIQSLLPAIPDSEDEILQGLTLEDVWPLDARGQLQEIDLRAESVWSALEGMALGKSAGVDEIPTELLSIYMAHPRTFYDDFVPAVNLLVRGALPEEVLRHIRAGAVTPIYKDTNHTKIRPIVPLNSLRKVVASALLREHRSDLVTELSPFQWGVGIRGGVESVVHWARVMLEMSAHLDRTQDAWGLLQIDFENAYGHVSRVSAIDKLSRSSMARMTPFMMQLYRQPASLLLPAVDRNGPRERVSASQGVTQGDPAGPAFFSLAIRDFACELASHAPGVWIIDDATVVGPKESLRAALGFLAARIGSAQSVEGLIVNWEKTSVWFPPGAWPAHNDPDFSRVRWAPMEGVTLLGSPVGTANHIKAWMDRKVDELITLVDDVFSGAYAQDALVLYQRCIAPKLVYLLRTTPTALLEAPVQRFDRHVWYRVAKSVRGVDDSFLDHEHHLIESQARLSTRMGGLGLHPLAELAYPAFSSSFWMSAPNLRTMATGIPSAQKLNALERLDWFLSAAQQGSTGSGTFGPVLESVYQGSSRTSQAICWYMNEGRAYLVDQWGFDSRVFRPLHYGQDKDMTRCVSSQRDAWLSMQARRLAHMLPSLCRMGQTRVVNAATEEAALPFAKLPTSPARAFDDDVFQLMTQLRLGVAGSYDFPELVGALCPECGEDLPDAERVSRHLMTCPLVAPAADADGHGWKARHDHLVRMAMELDCQAGRNVAREPRVNYDSGAHRADWACPYPSSSSFATRRASRVAVNQKMVDLTIIAPVSPGGIEQAELEKEQKYRDLIRSSVVFRPFGLSVFGALGPHAYKNLYEGASEVAKQATESYPSTRLLHYQRMLHLVYDATVSKLAAVLQRDTAVIAASTLAVWHRRLQRPAAISPAKPHTWLLPIVHTQRRMQLPDLA